MSGTTRRLPWIILAVAALVRLAAAVTLNDHPLLQPSGELDTSVYVTLARQVASGDWRLHDGHPFYVSPLYVYFLAAIVATVRDTSALVAARVVQALLGTLAVGFVWDTARRWLGAREGGVAGALAALCGVFVYYEIQILQAALDPVLTALGLWLLTRALLERRPAWWLATGVALGLHVLNRPNMLAWAVLAPLAGIVVAARARDGRPSPARGAAPLIALVGTALVVCPVTLRNYAETGAVTLVTSHGGLNFYIGNHAGADGTYQVVAGITPSIAGQARDARAVASRALGRPVSDSEASRYFTDQAIAWTAAHPGEAGALFLRKLVYTLNAIELSLNGSYAYLARDETTMLTWLPVGPWLLLPLGLVGAWFGARERRPAWAAWAAVIPVYAGSVALFFVSGRYRLPLLVPLVITSAAAVGALVDRAARGGWTAVAPAGAAIAIAAALTWWPTGLDDGRSEDRAAMIVAAIDDGRIDEGLARLARWEPAHPARGLLLYRAGTALAQFGDLPRAAPLLERALARAPDEPGARRAAARAVVDRGIALATEPGGRAAAITALELAVRLDSRSEMARLDLGVLYAEDGRVDAARAEAREALRLRPDYDKARAFLAALDRIRHQ